jgi:hypothetical protein
MRKRDQNYFHFELQEIYYVHPDSILRLPYLPVSVLRILPHVANKAGKGVLVYCSSILIVAVQVLVGPIGLIPGLLIRN